MRSLWYKGEVREYVVKGRENMKRRRKGHRCSERGKNEESRGEKRGWHREREGSLTS